jgi:ABC-type methionine transport system permease subunit
MLITLLCSLVLILLPLASSHLTSLDILGITASVLVVVVVFDFYARTCKSEVRERAGERVGAAAEEGERGEPMEVADEM